MIDRFMAAAADRAMEMLGQYDTPLRLMHQLTQHPLSPSATIDLHELINSHLIGRLSQLADSAKVPLHTALDIAKATLPGYQTDTLTKYDRGDEATLWQLTLLQHYALLLATHSAYGQSPWRCYLEAINDTSPTQEELDESTRMAQTETV